MQSTRYGVIALALAAATLAGCGDDDFPADGSVIVDAGPRVDGPDAAPMCASGTYCLIFTNEDNGCFLPGFAVGIVATDQQVTLTPTAAPSSGLFAGLVGDTLQGWVDSRTLTGSTSGGGAVNLRVDAPTPAGQQCHRAAILAGTLAGTRLEGTLRYESLGAGCASACATQQAFAGNLLP
jgi:hypothetical protein